MANLAKALPANVPGPWFVDSTCIDCDTCRQLAPEVFPDDGNHYMNAPAVMTHTTAGFTAQFGNPTSSVEDHTYPNAFCFEAMK